MTSLVPKSIVDKNGKNTTVHVSAQQAEVSQRVKDFGKGYVPKQAVVVSTKFDWEPKELEGTGLTGFSVSYPIDEPEDRMIVATTAIRPKLDRLSMASYNEAVEDGLRTEDGTPVILTELSLDDLEGLTPAAIRKGVEDRKLGTSYADTLEGAINLYDEPTMISS